MSGNVEAVLVAHYEAVREEEMERIRSRDRYIILFISASGIVGGVVIAHANWWPLALTVPMLAAVTGLMYAHTDVTLGALSHWLRYRYTQLLREYEAAQGIPFKIPHWDGARVHKEYVMDVSFTWRYFLISILVAGVSIISIVAVGENLLTLQPELARVLLLSLLVGLTLISAVAPIWAWRKRIGQA